MADQNKKFFSYQSYLYVICFIAMVLSIFWTTIGLYNLFKIVAPVYTFNEHESKDYLDFAHFQEGHKVYLNDGDDTPPRKVVLKTKEDWEAFKSLMVTARRHDGINNIMLSLIGLAVSIPVLVFHWKKAQANKDKTE